MDLRLIFLIVFFGSALLVLCSAIVVVYLKDNSRSKTLKDQAEILGFRPASKTIVESAGLKEIKVGNRQKIYNVFKGTFAGITTITFDMDISIGNLGYATGTPHGNTYRSSGVIFEKNTPLFLLRPRSIISTNTYNDHFSLEGDSSFMNGELANAIRKRYTVESTGTHILFVPSRKRTESIREELENAHSILEKVIVRQY